jgi:hypothetical protein
MTEKEMFILIRTVLDGVEDVVKEKSAPGPATVLRRLRKHTEQYEVAKSRA